MNFYPPPFTSCQQTTPLGTCPVSAVLPSLVPFPRQKRKRPPVSILFSLGRLALVCPWLKLPRAHWRWMIFGDCSYREGLTSFPCRHHEDQHLGLLFSLLVEGSASKQPCPRLRVWSCPGAPAGRESAYRGRITRQVRWGKGWGGLGPNSGFYDNPLTRTTFWRQAPSDRRTSPEAQLFQHIMALEFQVLCEFESQVIFKPPHTLVYHSFYSIWNRCPLSPHSKWGH